MIAQGPANVQLVLSVGIQIADGLSAAHQIGIYHRDLKPANVMLTDGGLVKILDFGLARQEDVRMRRSSIRRSRRGASRARWRDLLRRAAARLAYMAPEQFVTGQSSVQSDLFAFGVILYELVSGRHPFLRPDAEELQGVRAIQFADPPSLRDLLPGDSGRVGERDRPLPEEEAGGALRIGRGGARGAEDDHAHEAARGDGAAVRCAAQMCRRRSEEKRSTGMLSMLAERFRESADEQAKENSILVLPFRNFGPEGS